MSGNSSSAVRRGRCATAPECLQKQPLIVCIRLKPSFLERFHGDWDPLERKERELLALANAQATALTDRESRTAAMIVQVVETLVEAGLHNMEITMDTPGVEWALMYLHAKLRERVLLGAGTVLRLEQLQQAIVCGCRFAMSPVFVPDVTNRLIEYAEQHEVLFIPGAATPSECVQVATALGDGKPVKVFPADVVGGLRFVRAMAGPLGHIPLIPTSGITFDVVQEYLEAANVYAVGVSQQILPAQQISAGDWSRIHELARLWCRAVEPYARHDSNCFSSPGINA
ncbi:hypothetical protein F1559_004906 [Cyanidiococcus yangmingshanensis]|uniref:2-dehydro-3-deoxy-phosphogluconate aldolase n=1 Tax=Cyanidiococcus yangmingshanensis TaxID=2690220 RepID=A0A7J7IPS1_9RHOD|nr:hypothetical protein F1559_004906 [Cyanidiococcus yangmingshanensis]